MSETWIANINLFHKLYVLKSDHLILPQKSDFGSVYHRVRVSNQGSATLSFDVSVKILIFPIDEIDANHTLCTVIAAKRAL